MVLLLLVFLGTGLALPDRCVDSDCLSGGPRFFFSSTSLRCERLVGGCGSDRNTFQSLETCSARCHDLARCYRPVDYGQNPPDRFSTNTDTTGKPNDPSVNFFFYNASSGRCEGFHFRGSRSNGNLFSTEGGCQRVCGDVTDRCLDFMASSRFPAETFFYNTTSSRCERLHGDCSSNNNTFSSQEDCEALCHGRAGDRPLAEDPGNGPFNVLLGLIVLLVVFMLIITFVAIVIIIVLHCRRGPPNGYRPLGSDP